MQVTPRDLQIVKLVAEFRYATGRQVQDVLFAPGSKSSVNDRLSKLYQHAYLERHFLPLREAFGAARPYYTLDRRGADALAEVMEIPRYQLDWRPRDGRREPLYMEHALRINDVRALLLVAARSAALELEWTDERELKRRAKDHRVPDPLRPNEQITLVPDGYFSISGSSFALELDRGTVEEVPFKRKLRGYARWKGSGGYFNSFGTNSLRVLFVVTDARRDSRRLAGC
jgi:hypothetical protein